MSRTVSSLALSALVSFLLLCDRALASDSHAAHAPSGHAAPAAAPSGPGPSQALQRMIEGNFRYADGRSVAAGSYAEKREASARGQKPFAVVVTCSDSRVPPEIVFDQSIGDLFVVRSAGNVVDDIALGSIEYAVAHLGCSLVFVLGHERCGAVSAACDYEHEASGHILAIVKAIKPAFSTVERQPGDQIENTVRANVRWVVTQLATSEPVLGSLVKSGKLKVQGGRYDLDTGKVDLID